MSNAVLAAFDRQKYLNLETYRKNGQAMPTPVWFVQDGDKLYVRTVKNSGKVKRVRNNPRVRVAPCEVRGELKGPWIEAKAKLVDDPVSTRRVVELLNRKYGLMKRLFDVMGGLNRREYDVIEIDVTQQ
ncbi:MAG: PPOX class F420-dependent oxidoreductase [Candidatus Roseilinea sp.]|uniref:PPOX class F420-dependent oxidoreductase n=1 Tax=Candidatus Roseilinea sp. TaxID=2838777 RepID=UPI0040493A05